MKPAPFDYEAPASLDAALDLLARHGGDAKILAGGQSLIPVMNFRLAEPALLAPVAAILIGVIAADQRGIALPQRVPVGIFREPEDR